MFAWLFNFRRLVVRHEYHAENFQGFVHLAAAVILLAKLWPTYWLTALAVGYVSHIVADMLTRQGVPVLWPVHWRLSLLPIVTGGATESVIALAAGGWLLIAVLGKLGISLSPVWKSLVAFVSSYL